MSRSYRVNNLNQYTSAAPTSFIYNNNGNLTGDGTNSFVYDPQGRLLKSSGGAAGTTKFLYDGDELVAEYTNNGSTVLRRYVHGVRIDDPLVWYEGRRGVNSDHDDSRLIWNDEVCLKFIKAL